MVHGQQSTFITTLAHRIVAVPWVYDLVQFLAGSRILIRRLTPVFQRLGRPAVIVDLGGGTGMFRPVCDPASKYVCLDTDIEKLRGNLRKYRKGLAITADVTRAPIKDGSVDLAMCTNMSHHLDDPAFSGLVSESRRLLKPTGTLVFMDIVWSPGRWFARLLWKYDRGANPRTPDALNAVLASQLTVTERHQFAVYHEYVLMLGKRPQIG